MREYPITASERAQGVVNIAMHEAFFPRFQEWVTSQGLGISPPIAVGEDGDESTFRVITVPGHLLGKGEAQSRT